MTPHQGGRIVRDPATFGRQILGSSIKSAIDLQLAQLVGLPLADADRAVDMATFGFGRMIENPDHGGLRQIPEYCIHIQETWRITRDGEVLLGYGDWHYPPRGSTVDYDDFVERDERRNRQDDLRDDWFAHGAAAHTVLRAEGTDAGDLTIAFADRCVIETFVNQVSPGGHGDDEFWRLMPPPITGDEPHFVVSARGTEL